MAYIRAEGNRAHKIERSEKAAKRDQEIRGSHEADHPFPDRLDAGKFVSDGRFQGLNRQNHQQRKEKNPKDKVQLSAAHTFGATLAGPNEPCREISDGSAERGSAENEHAQQRKATAVSPTDPAYLNALANIQSLQSAFAPWPEVAKTLLSLSEALESVQSQIAESDFRPDAPDDPQAVQAAKQLMAQGPWPRRRFPR